MKARTLFLRLYDPPSTIYHRKGKMFATIPCTRVATRRGLWVRLIGRTRLLKVAEPFDGYLKNWALTEDGAELLGNKFRYFTCWEVL